MTATIEAGELAGAARWASRALPAKPTDPSMAGSVVEIGGGVLTIRAYDYILNAGAAAPASGEMEAFLVHGKMFADITAGMSGPVTLSLEGSRLLIKGRSEKYRLPLMALDQYPAAPLPTDPHAAVAGFAEAVARVAAASSADLMDPRPLLPGIHLQPESGHLVLTAMDGYRGAIERVPWEGGSHEPLTVGARRLAALAKEIGDKPGIGFGSQLSLTAGSRNATIGGIEGTFPDVANLLGRASAAAEWEVDVDRDQLAAAVRKASRFAEEYRPVHLDVTENAIVVSAAGVGDGEGQILVEAAYDGPAKRVGLQPQFLLDAITTTPGPVVRIAMPPGEPARGGVLFRACQDVGGEADLNHTHLVMTLRIPQES